MKDEIQAKLKQAMLARDEFLKEVYAGLKSAVLYEEVAKGKRAEGLSDPEVVAVVQREAKRRLDAAQIFHDAGDVVRADKEQKEYAVLAEFLPEQLTEAEVVKLVSKVIKETGAENIKDMGRVIGAVRAEAGARADGALVARLVREQLQ